MFKHWSGFIGQWDASVWKPRPETVTVIESDGARQVPLRKDWAVSAYHAQWDIADRGSPYWAQKYPKDYRDRFPATSSVRTLGGRLVCLASSREGLNQPYAYSYLFAYVLDLEPGASTLTLPDDESIRILAISVANEEPALVSAQPLYDTLE